MKTPPRAGKFVNLTETKATAPVMQQSNGLDYGVGHYKWEPDCLEPVLSAVSASKEILMSIGETTLDLTHEMADTLSRLDIKQDVLLRGLEAKYSETSERLLKIGEHLVASDYRMEQIVSDTELTLKKLLHSEVGYIIDAVNIMTGKIQRLVYVLIALEIIQAVIWMSRN